MIKIKNMELEGLNLSARIIIGEDKVDTCKVLTESQLGLTATEMADLLYDNVIDLLPDRADRVYPGNVRVIPVEKEVKKDTPEETIRKLKNQHVQDVAKAEDKFQQERFINDQKFRTEKEELLGRVKSLEARVKANEDALSMLAKRR